MMRTRAEMKAQAKALIKHNYWRLVLVSLILMLITSSGSSNNAQRGYDNLTGDNDSYSSYYDPNIGNYAYDDLDIGISPPQAVLERDFGSGLEQVINVIGGIWAAIFGLIGFIGLVVVFVIFIGLQILLFGPLTVGARRFFLVNLNAPAQLGELAYAFDKNYWNSVKTMFLVDLKIVLWSLLFIIPGIVKAYEYRMVPYLLAECPELDSREIFAASRELMDGNKWRAFVLDWSFILWNLLSSVTLGLAGIFYVNPYQNLTDALFYQAVCQEKNMRDWHRFENTGF